MKKQISVCIFLSVVLIVLSLTFIKLSNNRKDVEQTDPTQMIENTKEMANIPTEQEEPKYMFYILEKDTRLVVYETETNRIYMETGIVAQDLPVELHEKMKKGFFFQTEKDLYDFLESYSS